MALGTSMIDPAFQKKFKQVDFVFHKRFYGRTVLGSFGSTIEPKGLNDVSLNSIGAKLFLYEPSVYEFFGGNTGMSADLVWQEYQ